MRIAFLPALRLFVFMSVVTGMLYPLLVTGVAQIAFSDAANGSLISMHGRTRGSTLIGQPFTDARYFWSRPSATTPVPYDATASGGSNLAPSNPHLLDRIRARIAELHAADPNNRAPIPVDLVTTSASGLDPDISPAAAHYQIERVARARGLSPARIAALVDEHTDARTFALLGEPRVNVLQLNLALERMN